jgi:homocysteine S-methyltransferase
VIGIGVAAGSHDRPQRDARNDQPAPRARWTFPGRARPAVLDGGLATSLEAAGHDLTGPLWSARLLTDFPAALTAAHRAFFEAGADVATTASYQASFSGFLAQGIGQEETARLLRLSVVLASSARSALADGRPRWVAASVGPYGAALADGSEYRGRYGLTVSELADWHRPRLEVLASAGPDVLALETIPDVDEAAALVAALDGLTVPAWLSYSISGSRTRAGQPLEEAFAIADAPEIAAVGVNCCDPSDVTPALAVAREVTGKPVIVYPNSGEGWDAARRRWTGRPGFTAAAAARWVAEGAAAVGGCCRVGPTEIAAVARVLRGPFLPTINLADRRAAKRPGTGPVAPHDQPG